MMKLSILILICMTVAVIAQFCNNSVADCNYNGFCGTHNQCRCFSNYVTHDSATGCNYHQKSRLTAFLLELFLGEFGAGWFFLGRIDFAVLILVLTVVLACCFKPAYYSMKESNENGMAVAACLACGVGLTIFALWLHGMIMTGTGLATDSNGVAVGDW